MTEPAQRYITIKVYDSAADEFIWTEEIRIGESAADHSKFFVLREKCDELEKRLAAAGVLETEQARRIGDLKKRAESAESALLRRAQLAENERHELWDDLRAARKDATQIRTLLEQERTSDAARHRDVYARGKADGKAEGTAEMLARIKGLL